MEPLEPNQVPSIGSTSSGALGYLTGLPRWLGGKESTSPCRRHGFNPWVGKIPWRRKWQSSPVFLPGESHGQRNLGGYSSGDRRVGHE